MKITLPKRKAFYFQKTWVASQTAAVKGFVSFYKAMAHNLACLGKNKMQTILVLLIVFGLMALFSLFYLTVERLMNRLRRRIARKIIIRNHAQKKSANSKNETLQYKTAFS